MATFSAVAALGGASLRNGGLWRNRSLGFITRDLRSDCTAIFSCSSTGKFLGSRYLRTGIPTGESTKRSSSRNFGTRLRSMTGAAAMDSNGEKIKIVGISGSIRSASMNTGLLRASANIVEKDFPDVSIEILDISDLPLLNTDLEVNKTFPDSVKRFRSKVLEADGVLFACPEYNYSVTAPLKNAIDWASRAPNVWGDKGAAIVGAGGNNGAARAAYHLRQVGVYVDLHFLNKPELHVRAFEPPTKFDQEGNLVDEKTFEILQSVIKSLVEWVIRLKK